MSVVLNLSAKRRERVGKGAARATRRDGRVPGVIYGAKQDPLVISLDPREVKREVGRGSFFSTLYDLTVDGAVERVLPRDIQIDPVSDRAIHVDFLRVAGDTKITVDVPVHFHNEAASPGLKRGGVLNIVRHEIEFLCRADSIPGHIDIDLTGLEIGDSVHISSVALPEGVRPTITDRDFTIATIAAPSAVKAEAAEAAEAAAAAAAEAAEGEEEEEGEGGDEGEKEEKEEE